MHGKVEPPPETLRAQESRDRELEKGIHTDEKARRTVLRPKYRLR